ncbi:MAG: trehalose operon repressor [Eubacteriales bacterium]|nr:trehalose operon repressor [Eubacteriales bacterium]
MPAEKFEGIYRDLKEKIENGTYPQGTMLPSEHTMTSIYQCSRNTVRRAVALLINDGYVQSIHGKGVQIIYTPVEQASFTVGGIESFAETAKRNNLTYTTKVILFSEITVDEHVARRTGFPEGVDVYYMQRIRYIDGKPLILDINVFLKEVAVGLTEEIAADSIYRYLEDDLGVQIVTSNRKITAERATQLDSSSLKLGDYDFVAVITGQTYNSAGIMFEWTQSRHHPDYFVFYDSASRKKGS